MRFCLPAMVEKQTGKEVVAIDPVSTQIGNFFMTICCGLIIGLLFDTYRVLRGIFSPQTFFTGLGDLLFWIVSTLVVFGALLCTNWGEVRLYVFLGLIIGAVAYIKLFSRVITIMLIRIWRGCYFVCRWCIQMAYIVIWHPLVYILNLLFWPLRWIYRKPCRGLIQRTRKMGVACKKKIKTKLFYPRDPPGGPPG